MTKKYNYGFAMLKLWMCFEVVLCHFDNSFPYGTEGGVLAEALWFPIKEGRFLAVPCFMLMSFYLTAHVLVRCSADWQHLGKRLYRLLVPHIVWAIVYFGYSFCGTVKSSGSMISCVKQLILQFVFGHTLNPTMWFQVDLIILTFLYVLLLRFFGSKQIEKIALAMLIVGFAMQYTGLNYAIFSCFPAYMSYPLGRVCESIPYASMGILAACFNLFEKRRNKLGLFLAIIICIGSMVLFDRLGQIVGFNYQGGLLFVGGCSLAYIFAMIPTEKIPAFAQTGIQKLAPVTMGVYCMHRLVGTLLRSCFSFEGPTLGFISCIIIYCLSIITALLLKKIQIKWIQSCLQ